MLVCHVLSRFENVLLRLYFKKAYFSVIGWFVHATMKLDQHELASFQPKTAAPDFQAIYTNTG